MRLIPNAPWIFFSAAALPLTLPSQGKLDEAWEYILLQLDSFRHPVTELVASILCLHRSVTALTQEEQDRCIEEQYGYFERARSAFDSLPESQRKSHDFRELMELGFRAMINSLVRLGDLARARVVCDRAIAFQPGSAAAWSDRGLVRYPEVGAIEDFRKAIELGSDSYVPCYHLAHCSLAENHFRLAHTWIEKALAAHTPPGKRIQAQLHSWLAICEDMLGADRGIVEAHFKRALEIDPDHELVKDGYRVFLDSATGSSRLTPPKWNMTAGKWEDFDLSVFDRQRQLGEAIRRTSPVKRELQNVA